MKCTRCDGTGQEPLVPHLVAMLAHLTDEWQTTVDLAAKANAGPGAVHNALTRLVARGRAERREVKGQRGVEWRRR